MCRPFELIKRPHPFRRGHEGALAVVLLFTIRDLPNTEGLGESGLVHGGFEDLGVAQNLLLLDLDALGLLDYLHLHLLISD